MFKFIDYIMLPLENKLLSDKDIKYFRKKIEVNNIIKYKLKNMKEQLIIEEYEKVGIKYNDINNNKLSNLKNYVLLLSGISLMTIFTFTIIFCADILLYLQNSSYSLKAVITTNSIGLINLIIGLNCIYKINKINKNLRKIR